MDCDALAVFFNTDYWGFDGWVLGSGDGHVSTVFVPMVLRSHYISFTIDLKAATVDVMTSITGTPPRVRGPDVGAEARQAPHVGPGQRDQGARQARRPIEAGETLAGRVPDGGSLAHDPRLLLAAARGGKKPHF